MTVRGARTAVFLGALATIACEKAAPAPPPNSREAVKGLPPLGAPGQLSSGAGRGVPCRAASPLRQRRRPITSRIAAAPPRPVLLMSSNRTSLGASYAPMTNLQERLESGLSSRYTLSGVSLSVLKRYGLCYAQTLTKSPGQCRQGVETPT